MFLTKIMEKPKFIRNPTIRCHRLPSHPTEKQSAPELELGYQGVEEPPEDCEMLPSSFEDESQEEETKCESQDTAEVTDGEKLILDQVLHLSDLLNELLEIKSKPTDAMEWR